MFCKNAVEACHHILAERLKPGMTVVDATTGNGYDSLLALELIGNSGHLIGFDIDPLATESTAQRLNEAGFSDNVQLYNACHGDLDQFVTEPVNLILFNFGYLPGNKTRYRTSGETSCTAVLKGLKMLQKGGFMVLVLYPGHDEGKVECQMINALVKGLNQKSYHVFQLTYPNQVNNPPYLIYIERLSL